MKKKMVLLVLVICISLFVMIVLSTGSILVWYRSWAPFLDDGPFKGKPTATLPSREPDQVFEIFSGMKLVSYDADPNDPAPIVVLKSKDDKILWSIYAIANDMEGTKVDKVRFDDYSKLLFKRPRVVGNVDWTYGNERTWWFINKNGNLEEYWFSW